MSRGARTRLGLAALVALGGLLAWAVTGLPDFAHPHGLYAQAAIDLMLGQRHVDNTINAITFDLRGIDTLGEELILFCAATGATLLLRAQRPGDRPPDAAATREERGSAMPASLRLLGAVLVGPVLTLGVYVVTHGTLSPGGGFQGGVVLAGALLLVYVAGQAVALERLRPIALVEVAHAAGAAAYVLVAVGGLIFGTAVMANFLPLAAEGSLVSGGTVFVLNLAVGLEVTGAVTLILTEFLDQALLGPE
jgi:multicomponent Na+:H+ antiporter subunit B